LNTRSNNVRGNFPPGTRPLGGEPGRRGEKEDVMKFPCRSRCDHFLNSDGGKSGRVGRCVVEGELGEISNLRKKREGGGV